MKAAIILLFALGFASAAIGNALFFWMQARLVEQGIPARQFLIMGETFKIVRRYKETARSMGWSTAPFYWFWLALISTFVFLIAFTIVLQQTVHQ